MKPDDFYREHLRGMTRRHFFGHSARGLGTLALASLLNPDLFAAAKKDQAAANPLVLQELGAAKIFFKLANLVLCRSLIFWRRHACTRR